MPGTEIQSPTGCPGGSLFFRGSPRADARGTGAGALPAMERAGMAGMACLRRALPAFGKIEQNRYQNIGLIR